MRCTLLNRSSAILGHGTVLAKNDNSGGAGVAALDPGLGLWANTCATAKPTSPSTTGTALAPGLGPGPRLCTTVFNPSLIMPPVRTPRYISSKNKQ